MCHNFPDAGEADQQTTTEAENKEFCKTHQPPSKKGRERFILKVLSSSTGPPDALKSTKEMSVYGFHASSLKVRLNHIESKIAKMCKKTSEY